MTDKVNKRRQEPWPVAQIERRFEFHARHTLVESRDPKAKRLHDHVYVVDVILRHELNPHLEFTHPWFVMDFPEIDEAANKVVGQLHNKHLNAVIPVPPTSEAVAYWILVHLPGWVDGVRVSENSNSRVEVWRKWIKPKWAEMLMTGEQIHA